MNWKAIILLSALSNRVLCFCIGFGFAMFVGNLFFSPNSALVGLIGMLMLAWSVWALIQRA
jgi:hypothetical protein